MRKVKYCGDELDFHACSYHQAPLPFDKGRRELPARTERDKAQFNREQVAASSIMYTEAYTEYDEADIYDMLDAESLDEDTMGGECELLALVEFGALPFNYSEGY